jgi:hypothetical protein
MSLLDPKWKYTHSTATDIRKTFAKARKALAKEKADTRVPKLHVMCGNSEAAGPRSVGSRFNTSLYGTRSIAADGCLDRSHDDHAVRRAPQPDRRIA